MGYTKTVPNSGFRNGRMKPGAQVPAPSAQATDLETQDTSLHKAGAAYFFLMAFTFLLFVRPHELLRTWQDVPWAQMVAIGAVISYVFARLQGGIPFIWTREVQLVFLLTAWFILGLPFSFWRSNALEVLQDAWFKTLVIFFLLTQTVLTLDRARRLMWLIMVGAFIVLAFTIVNPVGFNYLSRDGRLEGANRGFLSGNSLGAAVGILTPYLMVFLVRSKSWIRTALLVSTFLMMMWVLVQTASRGNLLSAVLTLVLVYFTILRDNRKARLAGVGFAMALVVAVLSAPGVFWSRISTLWDEPISTSASRSDVLAVRSATQSEMQRKALLMRSIDYTLERPVFGLGLGNFAIKSGSQMGRAGEWKGTHNSFTQVSSEAGIPAFVMFVALIAGVIKKMRTVVRVCKGRPEMDELRLFAAATAISVYAFIFSAFFAHLAYEYYFYYVAGMSVAIWATFERWRKAAGLEPVSPLAARRGSLSRAGLANGGRGAAS